MSATARIVIMAADPQATARNSVANPLNFYNLLVESAAAFL
jgi:hypothetical protein